MLKYYFQYSIIKENHNILPFFKLKMKSLTVINLMISLEWNAGETKI